MADFSSRIQKVINEHGGFDAVAVRAGIEPNILNEVISGKTKTGIEAIGKIAAVADVSTDWLILG